MVVAIVPERIFGCTSGTKWAMRRWRRRTKKRGWVEEIRGDNLVNFHVIYEADLVIVDTEYETNPAKTAVCELDSRTARRQGCDYEDLFKRC
jgi:hypothetical protein